MQAVGTTFTYSFIQGDGATSSVCWFFVCVHCTPRRVARDSSLKGKNTVSSEYAQSEDFPATTNTTNTTTAKTFVRSLTTTAAAWWR